MFDNLNKELNDKQHKLSQGEVLLTQKDRELSKLKDKIKTMDESMRQLIQVTKITKEETEVSKARHWEEMDKIRKRQEDYQEKINRIQSVMLDDDTPKQIIDFKSKYLRQSDKTPDSNHTSQV